jgi:FKBP-type peptidyl-prolyl cis-trans isomerase
MKTFLVAVVTILFLSSCGKEGVSLPYAEQLSKDIALIDTYLSERGILAEEDSLGFRFAVSSEGTGLKPTIADSIRVKYSLRILNGKEVFQDSVGTFLLGTLIQPWKTVWLLYSEGTNLTLFVPSGLGYGTYPTGSFETKRYIPANSNLIFDIELKNVIREFSAQLKKDGAEIDTLLKRRKETVLTDGSQVRYKITTGGAVNGLVPLLNDSVVVNYKGKFLLSGAEFEAKDMAGFRLNKSSTPKSWQKVFPFFREGTKAILYVPSGLGYGAYGLAGVVLPYTNLVYEIELVKVIRK